MVDRHPHLGASAFVAAVALLAAVALVAAYLPAERAARIDPAVGAYPRTCRGRFERGTRRDNC